LAGAVAGAVLAIAPPVGGRPRVLMAVDAAALVAVGNAVRHAHEATVASFRPESVPATGSAPVPLRTAAGNG
jgi:hypothetical protein